MSQAPAHLIRCLKREAAPHKMAFLQDLSEQDYQVMLELASLHKVGANLYHALKPFLNEPCFPNSIKEELRQNYYAAAARNAVLYHQLLQTIRLLNEEGVEVILLKGAHLAEAVYGNLALRRMGDVDLLAREEDLPVVHRLLIKDGYLAPRAKSQSNTKHLAPYHKKKGVSLEVHYHITDPPLADKIDLNALRQRARPAIFEGVRVLTLSPEDLLLHLSIHVCLQHGLDLGLISCLDADAIFNCYGEDLDSEMLLERAQKWGAERSLLLLSALAGTLLNTSLPSRLEAALKRQSGLETALAKARELIFRRGPAPTRYLARLFGPGSLKDKIGYIKARAFPRGEAVFEGYTKVEQKGGLTRLIFYVRRPVKQLKRHWPTLLKGLFRDPATMVALENQNLRNDLRDWLSEPGPVSNNCKVDP